MMLVLFNVMMESLNVSKKNKRTIKCDKNTVIFDVSLPNVMIELSKCKKKIRDSPNVTKVRSHVSIAVYLLMGIVLS